MLRTTSPLLLVLLALPLAAQETKDDKEFRGQDAQRIAAWLKVSQDHAADYRLAPKDQPDQPLKLLPKAVFRHSQPVRGDDIGAVYLWVDDAGSPAALGTVFAYTYQGGPGERWVAHEFHSLSSSPLVGKWREKEAWSPAEPGVEWKEVPEAPSIDETVRADTPTARLRQMREIGRRFAARSMESSGSTWELRLLTQPIYQYSGKKDSATLGGGVFLFCQGTDPEVILLLEARKVKDRAAWHYALAPFTDYGLSVTLDDQEIWSLEKGHRPTRTSAHWWNGRMESKTLSAADEAKLAKETAGEKAQ